MRLQRALARAGVASRRAAEELIRAGRVCVNGGVATIGTLVDPEHDEITVGGAVVPRSQPAWIVLNKPPGYVVSRRPDRGMFSVFELLPAIPGLTYVGRLDVMTDGLLLFTTDGTAVHRLTHPRFAVERAYRVRVSGRPAGEIREALKRPVSVAGRAVALERFTVRRAGDAIDVDLVLTEGRNRIVRRLCEQLGLVVHTLTRISHGPVRLGSLAVGTWRHLTQDEITAVQSGEGAAADYNTDTNGTS